jgi:ATP-dependent helicase STH1/SNF2
MIKERINYRIAELEAVAGEISNDPAVMPSFAGEGESVKIKAYIELKGLKLVEAQRKLRLQVLRTVAQGMLYTGFYCKIGTTLATTLDRSVYRRMKKQSIRDARQTEQIEHTQRVERQTREKQKSSDYINSILVHGKEMHAFHRTASGKAVKLGQAVLKYAANVEKEEQRRLARISQERMRALKDNDEEAYMKLIDEAKDTRITTILSQTTEYLSNLTDAVLDQKTIIADGETYAEDAAEEEEGAAKGGDEAAMQDYYNTAHKIREIVTVQPTIMVGGTLKEYQIKGLQWMVSLYNNRLNGILADEMVCLVNFIPR